MEWVYLAVAAVSAAVSISAVVTTRIVFRRLDDHARMLNGAKLPVAVLQGCLAEAAAADHAPGSIKEERRQPAIASTEGVGMLADVQLALSEERPFRIVEVTMARGDAPRETCQTLGFRARVFWIGPRLRMIAAARFLDMEAPFFPAPGDLVGVSGTRQTFTVFDIDFCVEDGFRLFVELND